MRVCYTSDLHGDAALYAQLAEVLAAEQPALLILGGDLLADTNPQAAIGPQVEAQMAELAERITAWRRRQPRLEIACIGGNHETLPQVEGLRDLQTRRHLTLLDHRQAWQFRGLSFLGYGSSPPTPHWAKDLERLDQVGDPIPPFDGLAWDARQRTFRQVTAAPYFVDKPTIAAELAELAHPSGPWVFVVHAPPFASHLDRLHVVNEPVGSRAVRRAIETRQPRVALSGHCHESPDLTHHYVDRLGAAFCVNPGQGDVLHAVVFDTDDPAGTLRHTVLRTC